MLTEAADYATLYRNFRWDVPARFNIATAGCDRHADGSGRLALVYVDEDGGVSRTSFDQLRAMSSRLANVLQADGLKRGDRVVTGGGIIGTVQRVPAVQDKDGKPVLSNEIEVEIAPNLKFTVLRETIASVVKPVAANDSKPGKEKAG